MVSLGIGCLIMQVILDTKSVESYRQFKAIKQLPSWKIRGHEASFPDEYSEMITGSKPHPRFCNWEPSEFLFDYQRGIADLAIRKRKYAVFAECGLGKTLIMLEFAFAAEQYVRQANKKCLIVSPLMVVTQTQKECERWYGRRVEYIPASRLQEWLENEDTETVGITNYEAIKSDLRPGRLGCLALDESSLLKSHYGKWGTKLIELGKGLEWKLCLTGTPAPNDRIEYANHAVFLDAFPTVNAFLATYFVNRGQTSNRWELKEHAVDDFYRSLSHWCIFLSDPSTYGWEDNTTGSIPPIKVHIHEVPLAPEQKELLATIDNKLFTTDLGGIATRSAYGQIAKGKWNGKEIPTRKPGYVRELVGSWKESESTIVWCIYNYEQDRLAKEMPDAGSIAGDTPYEERQRIVDGFKAGEIRTLITKPKILGFGLNLEIATRQVFSGLQDSYESYHQAVKRSNRIGSTRPLNVHIPVTDVEEPMVANVLQKAHRVQEDTMQQERLFKEQLWTS